MLISMNECKCLGTEKQTTDWYSNKGSINTHERWINIDKYKGWTNKCKYNGCINKQI